MTTTTSTHGPCQVYACQDDTATHVVTATYPRGQLARNRILWTCAHHAEYWRTAPMFPGDRRVIAVRPLRAGGAR